MTMHLMVVYLAASYSIAPDSPIQSQRVKLSLNYQNFMMLIFELLRKNENIDNILQDQLVRFVVRQQLNN